MSRNRGWYGWSWKRDEVEPAAVGQLGERDDRAGVLGGRRDEDAELEVVPVVAHGRAYPRAVSATFVTIAYPT